MLRAYASMAALAACTIGIGCGGAAVPHARVTSSAASIRAAEEVGANSDPQAALHVRLAKEQRQHALDLIRDDKNREAERVLLRAEADAELAVALAREVQTRSEANKTLEEVRALRAKL
jgi:hypothetical protein